jgi:hypothetical protein
MYLIESFCIVKAFMYSNKKIKATSVQFKWPLIKTMERVQFCESRKMHWWEQLGGVGGGGEKNRVSGQPSTLQFLSLGLLHWSKRFFYNTANIFVKYI